MKQFITNHGIKMQIPALYIRDCKLYPSDPNYMFQIINHCLPSQQDGESKSYKVYNHDDGTSQNIDKWHKIEGNGVSLRLLKKEKKENGHSLVPVAYESGKDQTEISIN